MNMIRRKNKCMNLLFEKHEEMMKLLNSQVLCVEKIWTTTKKPALHDKMSNRLTSCAMEPEKCHIN